LAVNRRLDEWVKLDQLDLDSVEAVVDEKVEEKVMIISPNCLLAFILDFVYIFLNNAYRGLLRITGFFAP
jgi:hypothetical protein